MRTSFVSLLALLAFSQAAATTVSPVAKVISLLSDLHAKIVKEGEEAQATFNKFTEWCEDRSKNTKFEIKTATSEIAEYTASIEKSSSIIVELTSKIETLAGDIATNEADLKAATQIREEEEADFKAAEKELMDVIDALQRAIAILQREMKKGGASALLQLHGEAGVIQAVKTMVEAAMIGSQDAQVLTALIQNTQAEANEDLDAGAPAAAVYENKSGDIVDTLEGLLDKAEEQLEAARKKETTSKHNFEMLKQSLEDELKFGNKDLAECKIKIAATTESKKTAEGDLAMTIKGKDEDEKVMSTLKEDCMKGSEDYESGVNSRAEELKAIAEAKKVLSEMTGGAEDITYGLVQSFMQIAQNSNLRTGADLANFEAVRFVRKLAKEQSSEALMQLARRMSAAIRYGGSVAGGDPFAKVKGLIEDMIAKLEKDAEGDASHKAYCDKEMSETKQKKMEKEYEMDKLKTKIDSMTAKSAKLKEEVAALQNNLAELARSQAEMTKIRQEEKALYDKNKPEMEAGLEGVKMALKVLREYYNQDHSDSGHQVAKGAGTSIIGLLEVVESDFSKTLAEMSAAESTAASDYDTQTQMNEIEKKSKEQDVAYKTKESKQLDKATAEAKSDLEGLSTEHAAILEYQSKINEMCIAKPETYSERKRRRTAEIEGLKEALNILEGETVLLQGNDKLRKQHGLRGSALEPKMA